MNIVDPNDTQKVSKLKITTVANGFVVEPGFTGSAYHVPDRATFVFHNAAALSAWLETWSLGQQVDFKAKAKVKAP